MVVAFSKNVIIKKGFFLSLIFLFAIQKYFALSLFFMVVEFSIFVA